MALDRPTEEEVVLLRDAVDAYIAKLETGQKLPECHITDLVAKFNRYGLSSIPEIINYFDEEIARIRKPHEDALDLLINWLRPETNCPSYINPRYFISDRNQNRFKDFNVHPTVYKRTKTWDWQPITVGVFVPKKITKSEPVPIHVQWHGGGFVSLASTPQKASFFATETPIIR